MNHLSKPTKIVLLLLACACCLSFIGCLGGFSRVFTTYGIPQRQYQVGGGLNINYVPDKDGVVYLVEETSRKILQTKTLKAGEPYEADLSKIPSQEWEKKLAVPAVNAKFSLYFVPMEKFSPNKSKPTE